MTKCGDTETISGNSVKFLLTFLSKNCTIWSLNEFGIIYAYNMMQYQKDP